MPNIGRNERCPCGSGKKYKRCCLRADAVKERSELRSRRVVHDMGTVLAGDDPLDILSNKASDLIRAGHYDEAEELVRELQRDYPDMIDGIDRWAQLLDARGDHAAAADAWREAAAFARDNPGFDPETVDDYLARATRCEEAAQR